MSRVRGTKCRLLFMQLHFRLHEHPVKARIRIDACFSFSLTRYKKYRKGFTLGTCQEAEAKQGFRSQEQLNAA